MRQINPLYIVFLLIIVFIIVVVKLQSAKAVQSEAKTDMVKTEVMAKRLAALQKSWDNTKERKRALKQMLRAPSLRGADLTEKKNGNTVVLSTKKINAQAAEYLLNKLLNGTYVIKTVKIKQFDDESASMRVEIAL